MMAIALAETLIALGTTIEGGRKFLGNIELDNLEVLASGGDGKLIGGHGGQILVDNDFDDVDGYTLAITESCTLDLEGGSAEVANGNPGILILNPGNNSLVTLPDGVVSASTIIINDLQDDDP